MSDRTADGEVLIIGTQLSVNSFRGCVVGFAFEGGRGKLLRGILSFIADLGRRIRSVSNGEGGFTRLGGNGVARSLL